MDLIESLKFIDNELGQKQQDQIRKMDSDNLIDLHMGLGMWVRNNCGYWEDDGTNNVVRNVLALRDSGFHIGGIERLVTSKLSSDLNEQVDYNIYHPDNICGIVLELYHGYLNEKFTLEEIENLLSLDE